MLIHFLQYNLYTTISWILCIKRQSQQSFTFVSCHFGRYRILPQQSTLDYEPRNCSIFYYKACIWHNSMVYAESLFPYLGWHKKNAGCQFQVKGLVTRSGWRVKVARWTKLKKFFPTSYIHDMIYHACYCAKPRFKIYAFIPKLNNMLIFDIYSLH